MIKHTSTIRWQSMFDHFVRLALQGLVPNFVKKVTSGCCFGACSPCLKKVCFVIKLKFILHIIYVGNRLLEHFHSC